MSNEQDLRATAEAVAKWMGWKPCTRRGRIKGGLCKPGESYPSNLPDYADSLDAMREVEDEIKRRGLEREYACAVAAIAKIDASRMFPWLRVTAAQRLEAAARVIKEVGNAG